ncbi:MAG: hypothetical protein ACK559_08770, partial [bacterium]
ADRRARRARAATLARGGAPCTPRRCRRRRGAPRSVSARRARRERTLNPPDARRAGRRAPPRRGADRRGCSRRRAFRTRRGRGRCGRRSAR